MNLHLRIVPIEEVAHRPPSFCAVCYELDAECAIVWDRGIMGLCHPCAQDLRDAFAAE